MKTKQDLMHLLRALVDLLITRAVDKRRYLMIIEGCFSYLLKSYVVTTHLNRLVETVQMRGHTIFNAKLTKIIPYRYQIPPFI